MIDLHREYIKHQQQTEEAQQADSFLRDELLHGHLGPVEDLSRSERMELLPALYYDEDGELVFKRTDI